MFSVFLLVGLVALGMWAISNIAIGLRKQKSSSGSTKYYWQMNALWNVINFAIAFVAIIIVLAQFTSFNTNKSLQTIQIYIVATNILFDLLYVGVGLWLENRGKKQNNPRYIGYGSSIQLQGAFLFFFDSIFALALIVAIL